MARNPNNATIIIIIIIIAVTLSKAAEQHTWAELLAVIISHWVFTCLHLQKLPFSLAETLTCMLASVSLHSPLYKTLAFEFDLVSAYFLVILVRTD